jgi:hypothetical protein
MRAAGDVEHKAMRFFETEAGRGRAIGPRRMNFMQGGAA